MSKIATADESTVWKCDGCETLEETPNAFTPPNGWWQMTVRRLMGDRHHYAQVRLADACSKDCAISVVQWGTWGTEKEFQI